MSQIQEWMWIGSVGWRQSSSERHAREIPVRSGERERFVSTETQGSPSYGRTWHDHVEFISLVTVKSIKKKFFWLPLLQGVVNCFILIGRQELYEVIRKKKSIWLPKLTTPNIFYFLFGEPWNLESIWLVENSILVREKVTWLPPVSAPIVLLNYYIK